MTVGRSLANKKRGEGTSPLRSTEGIPETNYCFVKLALRNKRGFRGVSLAPSLQNISDSIRAGAKGYLLKDMPSEELAQAIRLVHRGYTQMAPSLMTKLMAGILTTSTAPGLMGEGAIAQLTPREADVLHLIGQGLTNRDIAAQLYIAEGTVKTHVNHLLNRLDLRNRAQLAIYAHSRCIPSPQVVKL